MSTTNLGCVKNSSETVKLFTKSKNRMKILLKFHNPRKQCSFTAGAQHTASEYLTFRVPDSQGPPVEIPRYKTHLESSTRTLHSIEKCVYIAK